MKPCESEKCDCLMHYPVLACIAMCAEQSPGGQEHAPAEPSARLCPAAGSGGHEDCGP